MVPTPNSPAETSMRADVPGDGAHGEHERHRGRADADGGAQPAETDRTHAEPLLGDCRQQGDRAPPKRTANRSSEITPSRIGWTRTNRMPSSASWTDTRRDGASLGTASSPLCASAGSELGVAHRCART